jgi:hypothetical protein
MLIKVDTKQTIINPAELMKALNNAWLSLYGETPKKSSIALLASQTGCETGWTHCYNHNLGNCKAPKDDPNQTIYYMALKGVWEIINGRKVMIPADQPGAWFRAFNSLQEGANFHLDFLHSKYHSCWQAVLDGSTVAFATHLSNSHYFTAPVGQYISLMNSFYSKLINVDLTPDAPTPTITFENNDIDFNLGLNIGIDDDQQADAGIDPNDAQS